ncbi:MAG: vWA domain-containing protein [Pseudomonadota bacterium]|nr:vWA domain-containing protein [Pseudomonadota bacterium]
MTSSVRGTSAHARLHPVLLWPLLVASCLCLQAGAKEAEKSVQALIVFDVSGSMRQSDPNRLSVAAAQLFGNLSQPGDTVGLAAFSDRADVLIPIASSTDPSAKETLQRSIEKLKFNGQTTDLAAALDAGLAAFHGQPDAAHRRLVLLLTDGALDLGRHRKDEEAAARTRILDSLIPEYQRRDIALYTIAFTSAADRSLLKEMSEVSAGESQFVGDAQTLHQAFSQIFIGAREAQSFPLEDSSLRIDQSIKELSLVFAKSSPDERIALLTPQQRTVQAGEPAEGMTWKSTPAYDLVHMHQPEAGVWQIERSGDVQSGVGIIAESTLNLQIELGTPFLEAGAALAIRAFLQDESQTPSTMRHEEGQTLTAEVSAPEGPPVSLPLIAQADGSFSASTAALNVPGKYRLTVTASSPTLQRQRTRTFEVHPQCFLGSIEQSTPVKVQVALDGSCPPFKNLSIEAEYSSAHQAKQRVPLREVQPQRFEAQLPSADHTEASHIELIVGGELPAEGTFTLTKGPLAWPAAPPPVDTHAPAPAEDHHSVLVDGGITLLKINAGLAILGALGYGIYWSVRRFNRGGRWKKP